MSTKNESTPSPSASSLLLPLALRPRQGSLASVTDKQSLTQALDQIHTSASQSESLTTFDAFASPPRSSSGSDGKAVTGDLVPSGLSGLYNRLRASVGGVKDKGGTAEEEDGHGDNILAKSPRSKVQATKGISDAKTLLDNSSSSPVAASMPASRLQSPVAATFEDAPGRSSKQPSQTVKSTPSSTLASPKASIFSDAPSGAMSPLASLTKATVPTAANPALASVNITAVRDDRESMRSLSGINPGTSEGSSTRDPLASRTGDMPQDEGQGSRTSYDKSGHQDLRIATTGNAHPKPTPTPQRTIDLPEQVKAFKGPVLAFSATESSPNVSDTEPVEAQTLQVLSGTIVAEPEPTDKTRLNSLNAEDVIPHLNVVAGAIGLGNNPRPSPSYNLPKTNEDQANEAGSQEPSRRQNRSKATERGPLTKRISQSRLPGYKVSRAPSSDASDLSSAKVSASSHPSRTIQNIPREASLKNSTRKNTGISKIDSDPGNANTVITQMRSKVLSKDFWMRDENAKDCFYCGDTFSTWRRKHHCRICGQIFDAKCMSLVSGRRFEQSGTLRVCKPCEAIINGYDDDPSDVSDGGSVAPTSFFNQEQSISETGVWSPTVGTGLDSTSTDHLAQSPDHRILTTPMMAIPATRRAGDSSSRRSAILEIDADQSFPRPTSSKSFKATMTGRSHASSHKRHPSRHQHLRSFRGSLEDRAPFHRNATEELGKGSGLPAFHNDSIIDPDLEPFMSDEESSGDEQMNIFAAMNGEGLVNAAVDNEKTGIGGLLAAVRKSRSRVADKGMNSLGFASRDGEDGSTGSMKGGHIQRSSRKRNLSINSNQQQGLFTRTNKSNNQLRGFGSTADDLPWSAGPVQPAQPFLNFSRMTRSASMRGVDAPAIELNNASLQHVRKLLRQLLQDSEVKTVSRWEKALIPILLQGTDDVNPDVHHGDDIDIRHYVKLKKVPGGRPCDTSYVSGVVFSKNLALKSMPRSISHPKILLVTFAIEYARHRQHFMSLEPVIAQEREFLENLVNRIAALRPQLLLVQRNVSGLALQFLEQANIATAYNVKPSVIEAIARCTQTKIISSIDKLAIKPVQVGKCGGFDLRTYVNPDIPGRKKTYIYLSGCPKELGCTVVLRGADMETLVKVKQITEFMVYVVYNLKLETCLMRDEFVLIPSSLSGGTLSPEKDAATKPIRSAPAEPPALTDPLAKITTKLQDKTTESEPVAMDTAKGDTLIPAPSKGTLPTSPVAMSSGDIQMPEDVPMPTFYGDMVEKHQTKILSASPFVKFMQPYILMRAREQERRLVYLKRLRDQDSIEERSDNGDSKPQKFNLITPEMVHETLQGASKKVREVLHAVHDAEYDRALHNYETQKRQWEAYIAGNINLFDPYAHQNIVVLYSVVCTATTVPCSGPDLLALGFYNEHETEADFEPDCTLGQYVEDLCLGANTICTANGCERKMFEHHRQYVHGEARVTVFVQQYPCKLRGLQETILMWSCCRICGNETQVMPMSDSTWKYSFGKYLELSFWSSELHPRAGVCPHDLHRNHIRYLGYKDVALRIHYDPITLLEIIVPRTRITWKVNKDLSIKNDQFQKIEERLNRFMHSVKSRIRSINDGSVIPEKIEACKVEIERLGKRANDEHNFLVRKLQDKYTNSKYYEVIPLNRAIRALQEKVVNWDAAFADFDSNFFPSERDIRRLAALQLKKIFLDREEASSITSYEPGTSISLSEAELAEKPSADEVVSLEPKPTQMSTEEAHDVLKSVIDEQSGFPGSLWFQKQADATLDGIPTTESREIEPTRTPPCPPIQDARMDNMHHLDLAMPAIVSEIASEEQRNSSLESGPVSPGTNGQGGDIDASSKITPAKPESPTPGQFEQTAETRVEVPSHSRGNHPSGIPRPSEVFRRKAFGSTSPPLTRTQSQPTGIRQDKKPPPSFPLTLPSKESTKQDAGANQSINTDSDLKAVERKISERLGISKSKHLKGSHSQSYIPRSVPNTRRDTRVSALAKHFEQLSREFEKERLRERRQRAAKSRHSRAYPIASSKPIVEVYQNAHEAVEERDISDEDVISSLGTHTTTELINEGEHGAVNRRGITPPRSPVNDGQTDAIEPEEREKHGDDTAAVQTASEPDTEAEGERADSDIDHPAHNEAPVAEAADGIHELIHTESQLDLKLELPKHERTSLMKMLTNFWAERSASGWTPLEYPMVPTEHLFADSDIIIREDEPSSLIAFALGSEDYLAKLEDIRERNRASPRREKDQYASVSAVGEDGMEVERSLLCSTGTHLKYQFNEGSARMLCKIFYAEQFDAVRRKCGVSDRIVESLSRCLKWDSKGGKTRSVFLKTMDDRFILKSLSPIETQAFIRFAPAYFQIMSEALFHELPSVIAKMLGFYQLVIRNPATGSDIKWDVLVMENLFYDRNPTRLFDLKGSMRNRKIQSTGEQNEVLLDENMVEYICESPLFAREHSKKLLRASVWNDTLFLARQNVMDYSLMIAIDDDRKELVVGIIDCIRTYTWDKKLESWIKIRGFAGGNKNQPTVTSPKEYKSRFREAMARYVLQAPNCWHQFQAQPAETRPPQIDQTVDSKEGDGTEVKTEVAGV
ncbi:MAG: hypothetical protein M1836_003731 [Candelina mexicana]|nr:MAG: hypothetical protein M1836_003731 [Candelina mexicana]